MEKMDVNHIAFDKMELNFKKSVLKGVAMFGAIIILLQIFVLQLVSSEGLFIRSSLGIFEETQLAETVIIECGEKYNGPDFDMHIENVNVENNIVTIKVRMKFRGENSDLLSKQDFILTGYDKNYTFNNYYSITAPQIFHCYGGERQIVVKYQLAPDMTENTIIQDYYLQCSNNFLPDNVIFKLSI